MISEKPAGNLKKGVMLGYLPGTERGVKNERSSELGYGGGRIGHEERTLIRRMEPEGRLEG